MEEEEVVGTCVYYYLPEPGHDARSRIGSCTCVHFGGSFCKLGAPGSGAVLDRTSGMRALPRVWRRKRFIVQRPLVGDGARIWIAHSPIAARLLECSNGAVWVGGAQTP